MEIIIVAVVIVTMPVSGLALYALRFRMAAHAVSQARRDGAQLTPDAIARINRSWGAL